LLNYGVGLFHGFILTALIGMPIKQSIRATSPVLLMLSYFH